MMKQPRGKPWAVKLTTYNLSLLFSMRSCTLFLSLIYASCVLGLPCVKVALETSINIYYGKNTK